jgi:curved DNA-binding protein CbpA
MLRPDRPWVALAGAPISVSFRRARGAAAVDGPRRGSERRRSRRLAHPPRAALLADPYDVLGVKSDAAPEEIKLAYRKRTKALHPDVNPSPNAAEAFRRVNRAYAVVSDKARRARFDLGRDLEARDDGFAPDGETRRRAARARYGSASANGDDAGPSDGYWDEVGSVERKRTRARAHKRGVRTRSESSPTTKSFARKENARRCGKRRATRGPRGARRGF